MKKNQKILGILVLILGLLLLLFYYVIRPRILVRPMSLVTIGTIRQDSSVRYRIDDNVQGAHQTFLTLTVSTAVNQNYTTPNKSYPEKQINTSGSGSDLIVFSPYTKWNGTDSLITTFKFRIVKNGVTYLKTGTERILCPNPVVYTNTTPFPQDCYFGRIQGTKQFLRRNSIINEANGVYYPSIDQISETDPIIVTWPPTVKER